MKNLKSTINETIPELIKKINTLSTKNEDMKNELNYEKALRASIDIESK